MEDIRSGNPVIDEQCRHVQKLLERGDLAAVLSGDLDTFREAVSPGLLQFILFLTNEESRAALTRNLSREAKRKIDVLGEKTKEVFREFFASDTGKALVDSLPQDVPSDSFLQTPTRIAYSSVFIQASGALHPHLRFIFGNPQSELKEILTLEWDDCLIVSNVMVQALMTEIHEAKRLIGIGAVSIDFEDLAARSSHLQRSISALQEMLTSQNPVKPTADD